LYRLFYWYFINKCFQKTASSQYPAALRHNPTPLSLRDYSTFLLQTISLLHLSLLLPYNPFLQHLRLPIAKARDDVSFPCLMSSTSSFLHYFLPFAPLSSNFLIRHSHNCPRASCSAWGSRTSAHISGRAVGYSWTCPRTTRTGQARWAPSFCRWLGSKCSPNDSSTQPSNGIALR
jgi:hypothetical protein